MTIIRDLAVDDVRFPTSVGRHGSDAMNPDPDYSAAYVSLVTNQKYTGHGLVFTLGRGTDLCASAIRAHARFVVGRSLKSIVQDMSGFWRQMTGESQLRWLGPEKGIVHMAAAAVINAVWDLWAKTENKPLWQLLCDLSTDELIACIDFRYLTNDLTPDEARQLLCSRESTAAERRERLLAEGYPAYTTSAGWLGYDDDELRRRCRQAVADGWTAIKLKVGSNIEQDRHRLGLVREEIGFDRALMIDANQVWEVEEAIEWVKQLAEFQLVWIEEPTSPDDILGHAQIARAIAPIGVATGEMVQNRVVFKQLMQSQAIQYCQIDSCRLGGVNEVLAVLLLAAKHNVPVCPHGGGVGLCEHIQHLSMFDFVRVSGSWQNRWAEYVDHLHEHFVDPVRIHRGRYVAPNQPGYSVQLRDKSIAKYRFPDGPAWG